MAEVTILICSFCGKTQKEVKKLIAGPKVHICDECIGLCIDILAEGYHCEPRDLYVVMGAEHAQMRAKAGAEHKAKVLKRQEGLDGEEPQS